MEGYAINEGITNEAEVIRLRQDIEGLLRRRVLEAVQVVLEEELDEALGARRYSRTKKRRGTRNGHQPRRITTSLGTATLEVPRGRILDADGSSREFRSRVLTRYQRRTRDVDEAILGAYLAGANTRRIRKALAPLLGEEHLSKSAVSRVAARLKEHFAAWSCRDLSEESYRVLFLDGMHLKVRLARRVVSAPVLAVLGVADDGTKRLVGLELALSEAFRAIIYAEDGMQAREAYAAFVRKWTSLCPKAVASLEEAGERLLTFTAFPKALWKAIRTTNSIENLNREFRRRTKTQASFSSEEAAVALLYGLVAFGQIPMNRIAGYEQLDKLERPVVQEAA